MFCQGVSESAETPGDQEDKLAELEEDVNSSFENFKGSWLPVTASLIDLFRNALDSPSELERLRGVFCKISEHPDPTMRLDIMEKIPRLALLCFGGERLDFVNAHLWSLVLSCLSDKNEEVRKSSEVALLFLIKGNLLRRETIEEQVCPQVVEISKFDGYASTVALMGKMAPLIGKEATEKHFLDRFVNLCSSENVTIRETCAKSIADMCTVLGTEITEKFLLPSFVQLCRDENVQVRVFCAEASISVSCSCSLSSRKTILAAAFTDLLMDEDEWVLFAAYGVLGAFICTFADPSVTKLDYDENGELVFFGKEGYEFRIRSILQSDHSLEHQYVDSIREGKYFSRDSVVQDEAYSISNALGFIVENGAGHLAFKGLNTNQRFLKPMPQPSEESCSPTTREPSFDSGGGGDRAEDEEADDVYNTFRFWRMPLPDLDVSLLEPEQDEIRADLNVLDNELSSLSEKLAECSTADFEDVQTDSVVSMASSPDSGWNSAETTSHADSTAPTPDSVIPKDSTAAPRSDAAGGSDREPGLPNQEIVPQLLLDYFVSMTVPLHSKSFTMMNKKIAEDCAYCLPAVALTLGPDNWPYIKNAYKCLSMNIKWRVRRTAVSSIHTLASILGEEIASKDLAPIFESFMRDLDAVKIGAVEHLADFLKLIKPETRNAFLPRLKEFLEIDFDWNWRYRKEFGKQLRLLINLYTPEDWLKHFQPLAMTLLCDQVAAVRLKAVLLFLDLIVNLSCEPELQQKLLKVLPEEFAKNSSWRRRQVFVFLCSEIAKKKALAVDVFRAALLDHLLLMSEDAVPNVRLCVARCLSGDIVSTGYISPSSPIFTSILKTLEILKSSQDPDIRYFASLHEEPKEGSVDDSASSTTSTVEVES